MTDALDDHEDTVSTEDITIATLRFSVSIDGLAGKEEEHVKVVEHFTKPSQLMHADQC